MGSQWELRTGSLQASMGVWSTAGGKSARIIFKVFKAFFFYKLLFIIAKGLNMCRFIIIAVQSQVLCARGGWDGDKV